MNNLVIKGIKNTKPTAPDSGALPVFPFSFLRSHAISFNVWTYWGVNGQVSARPPLPNQGDKSAPPMQTRRCQAHPLFIGLHEQMGDMGSRGVG